MAAGKICPAGQDRQRLPTSQLVIFCCWAGLNVRGAAFTTTAASEPARPASATARPASIRRYGHGPGRGRVLCAGPGAAGGDPLPESAALPPSGAGSPPPPGASGRIATPACYGLAVPGHRAHGEVARITGGLPRPATRGQ